MGHKEESQQVMIRFGLDDDSDLSVVVKAKCLHLLGDFELFGSSETVGFGDPEADSQWEVGRKNRAWGGGAFTVHPTCGANALDYKIIHHGDQDHAIVDVVGWGDFSVALDVTAHDYEAIIEDCLSGYCELVHREESGLETDITIDATLDEGSFKLNLGPLLGKQRSDGVYKTDVFLDVKEVDRLSLAYDGQSGKDWRGIGFGPTAPINDVQLGWRITPTGSVDFEIFHDVMKGGSRSRLAAFVTPDVTNERDDVNFQVSGIFDALCLSWNFDLKWSGESKSRCLGTFTFIREGPSA